MVNLLVFSILYAFALFLAGCSPWIYPLMHYGENKEDNVNLKKVEKKMGYAILLFIAIAVISSTIAIVFWREQCYAVMETKSAREFLFSLPTVCRITLFLTFLGSIWFAFKTPKELSKT